MPHPHASSALAPLFDLSSEVAVVTGGGTGLGAAAALALRQAGATVIILGRRADVLQAKADAIGAQAMVCDTREREQVRATLAAVVRQHGKLDILVNAAGIHRKCPSLDFPDSEWIAVHDVNTHGSFICATEAIRHMRPARHGKIINFCSYGSANGLPESVAYASSKGGLKQMTKSLAIEFAPDGIQVNAVEPGWFKTEMTAKMFDDPNWLERTQRRIPIGRPGTPDELDGAIIFLASRASDYITGIMLPVDGGAQAV